MGKIPHHGDRDFYLAALEAHYTSVPRAMATMRRAGGSLSR